MKLNTKLSTLVAAVSMTTLLVACGGGGTNTAGIGGSGITSSGTITGFGSVFVNGVKFETTQSSFDIEGTQGSQADLAIGMVVKVNGTINPDGVTGTATSIIFDDDLQGRVLGYPTNTVDLTTATFTIMGISVQIDRKTTYFDGAISFDTITDGNMVELSGFFDGSDTLIASRIERKTGSDEKVELKGKITDLSIGTKTFKLKGVSINASDFGDDLPNGLQDNAFVKVEGTYDLGTNTVTATKKVESEAFEYGDSHKFEMEGFVANYNSDSNFTVNGITIDASSADIEPSTMQIANNLQVEVEGRFDENNILIASEIKMRGGDIEVSAPITSIESVNNRFTVEPANGQTLIIKTGTETQFEDNANSYSVQITDLSVGDFVEVEGYQNDENNMGSIFASEVKITDSEEIEIQGIVESITSTTVTILGINFDTTALLDTENINTLSQLRDSVNAGNKILVKVELPDNNTNVITKIEVED